MRSSYGVLLTSFRGQRQFVQAAGLAAFSLVGLVERGLYAAPVTLAFEAEIASIAEFGGGVPAPTNVQIGETFRVRFTYDPQNSGGPVSQLFPLQIRFDDLQLVVDEYFLQVADEFSSWIPFTGSIADPLSAPIDDRGPGGVSDALFVSCGSSDFATSCGDVGGSSDLKWIANLSLYGENSTLSSAAFPSDAAVWNSFPFREMSVRFIDSQSGSGIRIGAFIGQIRAVPEPCTGCLVFFSIALLAFFQSVIRVTNSSTRG